jgi:hypothetical protein
VRSPRVPACGVTIQAREEVCSCRPSIGVPSSSASPNSGLWRELCNLTPLSWPVVASVPVDCVFWPERDAGQVNVRNSRLGFAVAISRKRRNIWKQTYRHTSSRSINEKSPLKPGQFRRAVSELKQNCGARPPIDKLAAFRSGQPHSNKCALERHTP